MFVARPAMQRRGRPPTPAGVTAPNEAPEPQREPAGAGTT
jgi:hypothetical protein